jgi:hypothetical protein
VTDEVVVVFQNCVNIQELVPGSHSEACRGDIRFVDVKLEVTDMQEEEKEEQDPLAVACPVIKTEHEVSFMAVSIIRHISQLSAPACFVRVPFISHTCINSTVVCRF